MTRPEEGSRAREGIFAHWPNRITALRFLGSLALFSILALHEDLVDPAPDLTQKLVFWLFIVIAVTDVLDGWLARRGNLVTAFGRIADPFVDKVLVVGTMIFLAVMPWSRPFFPAWIVVTILAREFLVTAIRGYVESRGLPFPADRWGKIKMLLQCTAIGIVTGREAFDFAEATHAFWGTVGHVFVWGTLISSVGSGISYVVKTKILLEGDGA